MFGKYPIRITSAFVVVLFSEKRDSEFETSETAITIAIIAPAITNFIFGFIDYLSLLNPHLDLTFSSSLNNKSLSTKSPIANMVIMLAITRPMS